MSARAKRGRGRRWFGIGLVVLFAVPQVQDFETTYRHQRDLASRGAATHGEVIETARRQDTQLVRVRFVSSHCRCNARAWVAITDGAEHRHPVGSQMAIRYDPEHPMVADARTDKPNPYAFVLFEAIALAVVLAILVVVFVAIKLVRRLRRRSVPAIDP